MAFYTDEEKRKYFGYYPVIERATYLGPVRGLRVVTNLLLKKFDIERNNTTLYSRPLSVQLEPTTKCNLRCKFCISTVWSRGGKDMSFEEFKKIIDQFPCLVDVLIQGMGEPLLCRDFFKMVEYCKKKHIMVGTTTNATLITDEAANKIVDSGITWVMISLDAATKEKFEEIRVGARFERVTTNIRRLVKARGNKKTPRLIVSYTGSSVNISELPGVVRLAKDIGFDGVDVWGVHYWGEEKLEGKNEDIRLDHNQSEANKIVEDSRKIAQEIGITFSVLGTGDGKTMTPSMHADTTLCRKVFKSCFITVDGYVTTCADSPNPEKMNFGNLLKEDFNTIWNNPKYTGMRKARLKGHTPEACKTCTGPHIAK